MVTIVGINLDYDSHIYSPIYPYYYSTKFDLISLSMVSIEEDSYLFAFGNHIRKYIPISVLLWNNNLLIILQRYKILYAGTT
jgi:hypothetical protein